MEKFKLFFRGNLKKILIVVASSVALLFIIIITVLGLKSLNPLNNRILVYRKDGKCIVRIKDEERVISDSGATDFRCDEKNKRVFFRVTSASSQDLYDLYYVENKNGEIKKPKLIDFGVKENYSVLNGRVYYLKANDRDNTFDGCFCDISKNNISVFSDNVSEIYILRDSEQFYFTKMHSDCKVLYSFNEGEPKEICRDLILCNCYNNCDRPHLVFEKKSATDNSLISLYIAYYDSLPQLICDSAVSVMLDEYESGGNLYYMTGAQETVLWTSVFSDQYASIDKDITKPQRSSLFPIFDFFSDYNRKMKEYNDKLLRDEVRETLNQYFTDSGSYSVPAYTVFAFNENGSSTVAVNVDPNRIFSFSHFGHPKLVYERTKLDAGDNDISALVTIAEQNGIDEVITYASSVIKDSFKSYGIYLAVGVENNYDGFLNYSLPEYSASGTQFIFSSDGNRLFAYITGNESDSQSLYSNLLGDSMKPGKVEPVNTDVSAYKGKDDSVIYMKSDINNKCGDVFYFNGDGNSKLSSNACAFFVDSDNNIIVLKNYKAENSVSTVDLYLCNDSNENLISENVIESSYIFEKNGYSAFICNKENNKRMLCLNCKGKTIEISENVSEIILFV